MPQASGFLELLEELVFKIAIASFLLALDVVSCIWVIGNYLQATAGISWHSPDKY